MNIQVFMGSLCISMNLAKLSWRERERERARERAREREIEREIG